jgi:hypothetical protein
MAICKSLYYDTKNDPPYGCGMGWIPFNINSKIGLRGLENIFMKKL